MKKCCPVLLKTKQNKGVNKLDVNFWGMFWTGLIKPVYKT